MPDRLRAFTTMRYINTRYRIPLPYQRRIRRKSLGGVVSSVRFVAAVVTFAKAEVTPPARFVCLSFCHSVYVQDYYQSTPPISLKLGVYLISFSRCYDLLVETMRFSPFYPSQVSFEASQGRSPGSRL